MELMNNSFLALFFTYGNSTNMAMENLEVSTS